MTGIRGWTLIAIVAIALFAGALAASPAFDGLRGLSLDALTALRWRLIGNKHDPSASRAVVVALDRDSYRAPPFKGTPTVTWTREIGRVVTAVIDGGAKVVGFDVVFPTSIEESEISFNGGTVGAQMRGFDRDFLRALAVAARAGKLVLGEVQHGDDLILPASGQRVAVGQQRNIRSLNVYSESDGVVRRTPLMLAVDDRTVPSMSLELASRALGVAPEAAVDQSVSLAGHLIPTAVPNAMTLNFDGGSNDIPTYSFADLRECLERGDVGFFRRNFEGKVVLFGSELGFEDGKLTSKRFATAPGARPAERCALPAGSAAPAAGNSIDGVYIHATAVNNLLRRDAITELAPLPRWLVITVGSAAATLAAFVLTPAGAALSFLLVALVWTVGATAAFADALSLPLLEPLVAGLIAIVATTSFRLFVTDKDKRFLRRTFELYLAPAVIEKMVNSSRPPVLGGEIRNVTVFFSDLAGFSSIAERMKPAELVSLMNRYLSAMTDTIEAHGGFVDKYIGDGIVAVFGAPAEGTDDAAQAVRAALACFADLNELNKNAAASNGPMLFQRVGLNSGQALVGNIGSRRRFNYTVMGDSVNLAARLEGANKHFGTSILASEFTMALTGAAFTWREIDAIRVKGRDEPVRIYEPLGEAGQQSPDQLACAASYSEGLALWRERNFAGAAQSFARWSETDSPSALFMARANKLSLGPPGEDWRPIQTLDEK
jgi:class 3 adenylate cyclase/CHASE2 domain-containing sensor protein